jgi:hypothetical protein
MQRIERLIGVYDADGTLLGELAYVAGHLLGRRSCALCDITHGRVRRRPEFDAAAATLGVPLELLHRDERSPALVLLTDGALPCVVADGGGEQIVLVDRNTLASCGKDPAALVDAIRAAAADAHLVLDAA